MISEDFLMWIHDDITWCAEDNCPIVNCIRNPVNMANHSGLHSYANFRESDECVIYRLERDAAIERGDTD